ncbi:MAG TPA: NTP transferase domain-containing protein [Phycisphaerae bacterium]|nr:NTP transferase domain-containing protein [Phycisphaerae bacterium]
MEPPDQLERVILMCAGRGERWGDHRGAPKHLVEVDGEALLDRTVRMVRARTGAEVVIVAFDKAYERAGCVRHVPAHGPEHFCDADKFLSSRELWGRSGQTVLLYGDVFFTEKALDAILEFRGEYQFFGRREGSYYTGRAWRELFAISFSPAGAEPLRACMEAVKVEQATGRQGNCGGWRVYERLHGSSGQRFTVIDDFTDDFDYPEDYERWLRHYRSRVHRLLVPLYGRAIKSWRWRLYRWRRRLLGGGAEGAATRTGAEDV